MFCRNCGAEVKDEWKICPNCGKEIVRNNVKNEQVNQQEKKNNKKNKKKIIVGAIIGVIVVGCAGIAYGVNANKTKNTQPKTTTASKIEKKKKESKGVANQDFEKLLDKSEDEIKKLGLKWNDEEQEYASENQDIEIKFKNGKIDYISIYGDEKNAPMFHGVRLGMSEKVARKKLEGYKANVRDSDRKVLGVVTDRYKIVQNEEAFSFTDALLGEGVRYETAGSLQGGKSVWLLAHLPHEYIISGERISPYLLFSNTHDGSGAVKVDDVIAIIFRRNPAMKKFFHI